MGAKAPIVKLFRFDPPQDSEKTQSCQSLATVKSTEIESSMRAKASRFWAKARILLRRAPVSNCAELPSGKKSNDPIVFKMH